MKVSVKKPVRVRFEPLRGVVFVVVAYTTTWLLGKVFGEVDIGNVLIGMVAMWVFSWDITGRIDVDVPKAGGGA